MEFDRNAIQRSDFAQARRGYDPDEVDTHLAQVAAAYEQMKAKPSAAAASMAGAAADQVRSIVEAAERTAHEIQAGAQAEAERATADARQQAEQERAEAQAAAAASRERAEADAEAHVASVRDATAELRARAEAMQSDLNAMVENLRESIDAIVNSARSNATSLENELQAYQAGHDAPADQAPPDPPSPEPSSLSADEPEAVEIEETAVVETEPDTDEVDALEAETEPATAYDEELLDEPVEEAGQEPVVEPQLAPEEPDAPDEPQPEPLVREPVGSPEPEDEPAAGGGGDGDGAEGARLIALNMALNGTPREETSRYLEENFDLENPDNILDEVYSRVGG